MTSLQQPVGVWHEILMRTARACLWTLYLVLHFTRARLCFVHLPLLIKLLSILHSNALLGRLVYVLIGLPSLPLPFLSPITVGLLFIHKTIGCVHQTRPRKGTRHSATCFTHTLIDHHICHGVTPLGRHVKNGSFSSLK